MPHSPRDPAPGWTLLLASVAAFMTSLDTQVVTTALPTIRAHLGGTVAGPEWTMNAYYLPFACLLIPAAGLGDRWGRRRILMLGLALFGTASFAAALAPDLGALVVARALQGAGAAAVMPLTLTVISAAYPPGRRGRAIGIWGALLGLGGVFGPLVGGGLVQWAGWRAIFWVNVPIAVIVIAGLRRTVTESHGPRHPLDLRGLVLAAAGLLGISWSLVHSAEASSGDSSVWLPLAAGCAVLIGFVAVEHAARYPMMPTGLFRSHGFTVANAVYLTIYGSVAGGVYLMSQFFQIVQHASPVVAALRFAPWPAPAMLLAPLAATVFAHAGGCSTRATVTIGFIHAMWACVILSAAGVVTVAAVGGRAEISAAMPAMEST